MRAPDGPPRPTTQTAWTRPSTGPSIGWITCWPAMKAGSRTRTPAPRSVATPTSEVNTEGNWRWTFTGKQPTAMTPMRNLRPPTASPADSVYGRVVQATLALTEDQWGGPLAPLYGPMALT